MNTSVNILGGINLHSSMTFKVNTSNTLPENPEIGTLAIKDGMLYGYFTIQGVEVWYPFSSQNSSYVHTQGVASQEWIIQHNLNSENIWYQVRDSQGNITMVGAETITSRNEIHLKFSIPITGVAVLVAARSIDVPAMSTSLIEVGSNVVIDTTGVKVNGEYVLTNADFYTNAQIDKFVGDLQKSITSNTDTIGTLQTDLNSANTLIKDLQDTKQPNLISGTNIKTINKYDITGSGNITLTKSDVGLSNVDNTADIDKAVLSSTKLATARNIAISGDATGSATFDGTTDISINTTLANSGVTAGTYPKVTVDVKGRVTSGTTLTATDIPNLDYSKITTGKPINFEFKSVVEDASTTLPSNGWYIFNEKKLNGLTVKLTDSPSIGDKVEIFGDGSDSDSVTIYVSPNGKNFDGSSQSLKIDVSSAHIFLVYISESTGWKYY
jgi:hypothetical protein